MNPKVFFLHRYPFKAILDPKVPAPFNRYSSRPPPPCKFPMFMGKCRGYEGKTWGKCG
jgi:hypothetical protein